MFVPARSGACPSTSSWCRRGVRSARTTSRSLRVGDVIGPAPPIQRPAAKIDKNSPIYVDHITYLLFKHKVSWATTWWPAPSLTARARRSPGARPLSNDAGVLNPLPYFDTVRHDKQVRNIRRSTVSAQAAGARCPVSWGHAVPRRQRASAGCHHLGSGLRDEPNAVIWPDWNSTATS
jgi:hypothetical protein